MNFFETYPRTTIAIGVVFTAAVLIAAILQNFAVGGFTKLF